MGFHNGDGRTISIEFTERGKMHIHIKGAP
jgi:hypothetical protein